MRYIVFLKRLPRDLSGSELVRCLSIVGYVVTRQTGSHVWLTTNERGARHVTIPNYTPLRIGTLAAILAKVAAHLKISRDALPERIFR